MRDLICLKFKIEKKLNVGAGSVISKITSDNPLLRINDKILIPGSTIKGILRTSLIRISSLLGHNITPTVHPEKMNSKDIVTSLFGKPDSEGKIFVRNVFLDSNTITLTHVKLNDKTNTCEEGKLFSTEYLPHNFEFEVLIELYDVSSEEFRSLMAAIAELNYERFGQAGIVSVRIDKSKSVVNPDLLRDEISKMVWEELGV